MKYCSRYMSLSPCGNRPFPIRTKYLFNVTSRLGCWKCTSKTTSLLKCIGKSGAFECPLPTPITVLPRSLGSVVKYRKQASYECYIHALCLQKDRVRLTATSTRSWYLCSLNDGLPVYHSTSTSVACITGVFGLPPCSGWSAGALYTRELSWFSFACSGNKRSCTCTWFTQIENLFSLL